MKRIFEPGDVEIKYITLKNPKLGASINPIEQITGFDIFEDMAKPTLYATVFFNDNIGLIEDFPIIGEEEIEIEFKTPGQSDTTKYKFRSFELTNVSKNVNGKGATYTLRCVSEEHLYNASDLITQSFQDTVSNIVPIILTKYLKTKKEVIVDEAKGIQTLAVPRLNPLQTIDMCRKRAVSKQFPTSSYVFFENQAGFNFKTVEGLLKDGKPSIGSRVFNAAQNVMASKETQANSFRTMLGFENIAAMDSNKKAAEGVFKAVTRAFNISTKEFSEGKFDLKNVFGAIQKFDKTSQLPNTDEFIDKFASGVPKSFFVPIDTLRPDNFIDTAIAVRNSFAVLLNSNIVRVLIHGDSGLKVGDVVTLHLPAMTGTTGKKKEDQALSGNYIIVRLRHMITPSTKSKHQIVFDCASVGL
jgi:hypothetical protein